MVGHQAGAGRHKGRLGALLVRLADGTSSPSAPASRTRSGKPRRRSGRSITFRYQELSDGGVPRFPSYVGVRIDAPAASKPVAAATVAPATATGARAVF